jgi:hypothetical protein
VKQVFPYPPRLLATIAPENRNPAPAKRRDDKILSHTQSILSPGGAVYRVNTQNTQNTHIDIDIYIVLYLLLYLYISLPHELSEYFEYFGPKILSNTHPILTKYSHIQQSKYSEYSVF